MPRNGVSSAAPSRAPPRPAGRSRGSASRPPSISSHRAHGASQASPSASRSPFAKPKGGTVSEPEEAASPRATSSRNGGRDHLGMVGDIKSERWARSFRNGGRHRAESATDSGGAYIRTIYLGSWDHSCGKRLVELQENFSWVIGSINPIVFAATATLWWTHKQEV